MAMNLKNFFDLNKVVFSKDELELPYEAMNLSELSNRSFSYASQKKKLTYATKSSEKQTIKKERFIGEAA
ncbi:hypothetical protein [Streptococcus mutans]|uniref:hypothetical protein n=1 Tax=Streptococcus mutans TaxID=1309 RepID=UPI0002B5CE62|nr:hypothetical protein [Streptococcus mutans]EMC02062.1 hypothetical protein SMU68_07458 [Streptococcus mutans NFSM1]MCB4949148.1 hypothetical protein [Streptococcus mutans]MCB4960003.1 hypothetical protein [Streptococcus mutans]MCB5077909.1 hypothetical protein [Streptococcus mutans]MCB5127615.1 hypothetical protein [Streptococcus mutans]